MKKFKRALLLAWMLISEQWKEASFSSTGGAIFNRSVDISADVDEALSEVD